MWCSMNMTFVTSPVEAHVAFEFSLINGLSLGLEHISQDEEEDDEYYVADWVVVVSLLLFRIANIRLK